jgi:hypothetical protein
MTRIINAAVILLALRENEGVHLNLPRDRAWYERFFFDPRDGVRGFYERDSSGDVLVHGRVLDWVVVNNLGWDMADNTDRGPATELAIKLHEQQGVDFSEYNLVALVVAAPPPPPPGQPAAPPATFAINDGSSGAFSATGKYHHAILARDGAAFDFIVHEVGHGLGLDHSCGNDPRFKTEYGQPTEYGHPFCVMSAASYGARGAAWYPPAPGEPRPDYVGRCPSINAATARALGWIDAHIYNPAVDGPRSFVLTSLDGARRGVTSPPAVQITTPEGVFVVEYRGPAAWDLGQREPVIIVNQGAGGRADLMHPGTNSGTYLGHIQKGFDPSSPGSVVNADGFGLELADLARDSSTATVRFTSGRVNLMPLNLIGSLQLRRAVILTEGSTTFDPGDRLCVSGTWGYQRIANLQVATFEATWARTRAETVFAWEVAGFPITDASGELRWWGSVKKATPKLTHTSAVREVRLKYEVAAIPGGSRLTLSNDPDDETYQVGITVRMADPVAASSAGDTATFTGIEYVYPREFYDAEQRCLDQFQDPNRSPSHLIVLPPDLWLKLAPEEAARVRGRVAVLEQIRTAGDITAFKQGRRQLARQLGINVAQIRSVRLGKASPLPKVRVRDEPPGFIMNVRSDAQFGGAPASGQKTDAFAPAKNLLSDG